MASFGRYIQVTLERSHYVNLATTGAIEPVLDTLGSDQTPQVITRRYQDEELELSNELKCTFDFKTGSNGIIGSVKVYNLSEESREFPFNGKGGLEQVVLKLTAGYEDNYGKILQCSVADINEYRQGADLITEYVIGSTTNDFDKSNASVSYESSVNLYQVLLDALELNDIDYINEIDDRFSDGTALLSAHNRSSFVFSGTVAQLFDQFLVGIHYTERDVPMLVKQDSYLVDTHTTGLVQLAYQERIYPPDWWELRPVVHSAMYDRDQFGVIRLYWDDAPRIVQDIVSIDHETGIIEVPLKTSNKKKKKVTLKHILVPELVKHAIVRVKTSGRYGRLKDGDYRVEKVKYKGSNYGGDHFVKMELGNVPESQKGIDDG